MKAPAFTTAEAQVIYGVLRHTWIPRGKEEPWKSALRKLEVMSRVPEEHPYSNRGSNRVE